MSPLWKSSGRSWVSFPFHMYQWVWARVRTCTWNVCLCRNLSMGVHVCVEARGWCLLQSFSFFSSQGLSLNLEVNYSALRLVSEFQESVCLHPQWYPTFYRAWESWSQLLTPLWQKLSTTIPWLQSCISFLPSSPEVQRQRTKDTIYAQSKKLKTSNFRKQVSLQAHFQSDVGAFRNVS